MSRIYVASSWRNDFQPIVVGVLRDAGHDVYDFKNPAPGNHGFHWSEIDPAWKAWDMPTYRDALNHPVAQDGFKSDYDAMLWADTGVMVLPCGRSAHIEAGYFNGAGKRLFIYCPEAAGPQEPELMYRMADGICLNLSELVVALERPR